MKRVEIVLGYKVIYEPNELGGYNASIPALNGITTQGRTLAKARLMARDAIEGYLQVLIENDLPIPEEGDNNHSVTKHGGYVSIPNNSDELSKKTLKSILRQAGLSVEELIELLKA